MKKNILVLMVSLTVTVLFSCMSLMAAEKTEIAFWTEFAEIDTGPPMDKIVDLFNEKNPDMRIQHIKFPNTPYEMAIKAAFAGGEPPVISEHNLGTWVWRFARTGSLLDLTDFINQRRNRLLPGAEAGATWHGKIWGLTWEQTVGNLIWYNVDILKDNGIDPGSIQSWSEFLDACGKLKNRGIVPIAFGNKVPWTGAHWISHFLQRLLGERKFEDLNARTFEPGQETELKFNQPEGIKAWELFADLHKRGYFSPGFLSDDFRASRTYFLQGKAAFFQTGFWLLGAARSEAPDLNIGYILFPEIEGYPGKQTSLTMSGLCISIAAKAKREDQELAKRFLDYLSREEAQSIWVQERMQLPAWKIPMEELKIDPLMLKLYGDMEKAPTATTFQGMQMTPEIFVPYVRDVTQGILTGALTPEEAADQLEQAVQEWQMENR